MRREINNWDDAIYHLYERSMEVNEIRQKGITNLPITNYEELLDWTMNIVTSFRDQAELINKEIDEINKGR